MRLPPWVCDVRQLGDLAGPPTVQQRLVGGPTLGGQVGPVRQRVARPPHPVRRRRGRRSGRSRAGRRPPRWRSSRPVAVSVPITSVDTASAVNSSPLTLSGALDSGSVTALRLSGVSSSRRASGMETRSPGTGCITQASGAPAYLHHRYISRTDISRTAADRSAASPVAAHPVRERPQQHGLADPGLTGHQHQRSAALGGAAGTPEQHVHGVVPLQCRTLRILRSVDRGEHGVIPTEASPAGTRGRSWTPRRTAGTARKTSGRPPE